MGELRTRLTPIGETRAYIVTLTISARIMKSFGLTRMYIPRINIYRRMMANRSMVVCQA